MNRTPRWWIAALAVVVCLAPARAEGPEVARLKEENAQLRKKLEQIAQQAAELQKAAQQERDRALELQKVAEVERQRAIEAVKKELAARAEAERALQQALAQSRDAQERARQAEAEARRAAEAARAEAERARQALEEARRALQDKPKPRPENKPDDPSKGPDLSDPKVRSEVSKQSQNNLKMIGIAMHNYHDTHRALPGSAIHSKDGKPLLSWRVAILPYVEENDLYKQFKLDEPWDSDHNKKLIAKMPKLYLSPGKKDGNETFYRVFTGKNTMFPGQQGLKLFQVPDGTSNTLMAVEAGEGVPWTKPDELTIDKKLPKLGGILGGEFNILMGDGSVRKVSAKFDEEIFRLLIDPSDGQVINIDGLNKEK